MQLVKVNYLHGDEVQAGRAYTYFSEETLAVGDKVEVPVRDTVGRAVVCEVDVPVAEIIKFYNSVKTIRAGSKIEDVPEETEEERLGNDPFPEYPPEAFKELEEIAETPGGEVNKFNPDDIAGRLSCNEAESAEAGTLVADLIPNPGFLMDEAKEIGNEIALIRVRPQQDPAVFALSEQAERLRDIALVRRIVCDADLTPATEDLSVIAQVKKGLAAIKTEYVKPIKGHLDDVTAAFNMILRPLEEADSITRAMILAYRKAAVEKARQAAELNRQAEELARKQAEFSGTGEFTVDTTPVEAAKPIGKVQTDIGSAGVMKVVKWELVDKALVPEDYKILDAAKITKIVKAGGSIPGIRVYTEDTLRVNTR